MQKLYHNIDFYEKCQFLRRKMPEIVNIITTGSFHHLDLHIYNTNKLRSRSGPAEE
jgi:hypothetical protein